MSSASSSSSSPLFPTYKERLRSVFGMVLRFFGLIYTEPVGFAAFLGTSIYVISQQAGLYQVICNDMYPNDPQVICNQKAMKRTPAAEDKVQQEASLYNIYTTLCYLFPSALASMYLGEQNEHFRNLCPICNQSHYHF